MSLSVIPIVRVPPVLSPSSPSGGSAKYTAKAPKDATATPKIWTSDIAMAAFSERCAAFAPCSDGIRSTEYDHLRAARGAGKDASGALA